MSLDADWIPGGSSRDARRKACGLLSDNARSARAEIEGGRDSSVANKKMWKGASADEFCKEGSDRWVQQLLQFMQVNGQELLTLICGRYKLNYTGNVNKIPASLREQVAHSIIFNPALPKGPEGLPAMLRDVKKVTGFKMAFVQEADSVTRTVRVKANLGGDPFSVELRACSNCGSCFSGRFMEAVASHQRAGGWKEITDKISAGRHSWNGLRGWRLCVPCFVNWGIKGTTENAKRNNIDQVLKCCPKDVYLIRDEGTQDKKRKAPEPVKKSDNRKRCKVFEPSSPMSVATTVDVTEDAEEVEVYTDGDWWDAHIIDERADGCVRIHYVGSTDEEDEWIHKGSARLRAPGSQQPSCPPTPLPPSPPIMEGSLPPSGANMDDCGLKCHPAGADAMCSPVRLNRTPSKSASPTAFFNSSPTNVEPDFPLGHSNTVEPLLIRPPYFSADLYHEPSPPPEMFDYSDVTQITPAFVEVDGPQWLLAGLGGEDEDSWAKKACVVLEMQSEGGGLRYEWLVDGVAVKNGEQPALQLDSRTKGAKHIACRVYNEHGSATTVCPVKLPCTPARARAECDPSTRKYVLECVCGEVRDGCATDLCLPCIKCNQVCMGTVRQPDLQCDDA